MGPGGCLNAGCVSGRPKEARPRAKDDAPERGGLDGRDAHLSPRIAIQTTVKIAAKVAIPCTRTSHMPQLPLSSDSKAVRFSWGRFGNVGRPCRGVTTSWARSRERGALSAASGDSSALSSRRCADAQAPLSRTRHSHARGRDDGEDAVLGGLRGDQIAGLDRAGAWAMPSVSSVNPCNRTTTPMPTPEWCLERQNPLRL